MFKHLLLIIAVAFAVNQISHAQCPPIGQPFPADNCFNAPLFCDLDGYCNTTSSIAIQQPFPGCQANVIDNPHWFAFRPLTNQLTMEIIPSNCAGVAGQMGMHGGIYEADCSIVIPIALQCQCSDIPFMLNSNNMDPCKTYYLVLDGCAGDICDYVIDIHSGGITCNLPTNDSIGLVTNSPQVCPPSGPSGCQRVCENATVAYEVTGVAPNAQVEWSITGAQAYTTNGNTVEVQWGAPGAGNVSANVLGIGGGGSPLQAFCGQTSPTTGGVSAIGGAPPYQVTFQENGNTLWTQGFNQGSFHELGFLQPGYLYTTIVTDAAGQTDQCSFSINNNSCWISLFPLSLNDPSSCNACDGSLDLWAIYTYTDVVQLTFDWSNGQSTGPDIDGLCAGQYSVTVQDQLVGNCMAIATVQLACNNNTPVCYAPLDQCVEIIANPEAAITTVPAPNASGVVEVCQGQEVIFSNNSQNASTYAWYFGDGQTSAEAAPHHTYANPGTYSAMLVARNACFCADTAFVTVQVYPSSPPELDCVGSVCEGEQVTYSTTPGCSSYTWAVSPNGTIIGGGGPTDDFITVEWVTGPEGFISIQTSGCSGAPICSAANVVPIAIMSENAQIEGPEKVCDGDLAEYTIPNFLGAAITWSVGPAGSIEGGQGTYRVKVRWSSGYTNPQYVAVHFENCFIGCAGNDTLTVNLRPDFFVEGSIQFCQNDFGQFAGRNSQSLQLVLCNWQLLNAAGNPTWSSPTALYNSSISLPTAGNFTVRATPVSTSSYCNDVYEVPITVFGNPPPIGAIQGETMICTGKPYTYEAPGFSAEGLTWTVNDGGDIYELSGNPVNITWHGPAPYQLSVIQTSAENGLLCSSTPSTFIGQDLPNVTITGPPVACEEATTGYSANILPQLDYQWTISPADAGTISNGQGTPNITVQWNQAGPATLELEACNQTASFLVNVIAKPAPMVPDALICPGETVQVATSTAYQSYEWKNAGGVTVSNLPSPLLGGGNYQVVVTNQQGCTGNGIFKIDNHPLPQFSLTAPIYLGLCGGGPGADIVATTQTGGLNYAWSDPTGPIGFTGNSYHTNTPGVYTVTATSPEGCTTTRTYQLFDCEAAGGICINGICTAPTCDNPGDPCVDAGNIAFSIIPSANCATHKYNNNSTNFVPGTLLWTFADGSNSSLPNPTVTYSSPGYYGVLLEGTVPDATNPAQSCPDGQLRQDSILAVAKFKATSTCPGQAVEFTDLTEYLPSVTLTGWSWDFGDPSSGAANSSTQQHPTHSFQQPGTYSVTLTVTVNGGCSAEISQNVTINPLPVALFAPPSAGCADLPLDFQASTSANTTSYVWDFGDPASGAANSSAAANAVHQFSTGGIYQVMLTVGNVFGCTASNTQQVSILPNDLTGQVSPAAPAPICPGESVTLAASASEPVSYSWTTSANTSSITVSDAGIYAVTMTGTDGCKIAPPPVVLDVFGPPIAVVQGIEYNEYGQVSGIFTNSYQVCEGEDVNLQVLGEQSYNYQWSNGSSDMVLEFSEDKDNLLGVGTHVFNVTVTDGLTGCTTQAGITVTVSPAPVVSIASNPPGVLCANTPATLNIQSPNPSISYTWATGETGTSINVVSSGIYYAVGINGQGCTGRSNEIEILTAPGQNQVPLGCLTRCIPAEICLPALPQVASYQWLQNGLPIPPPLGTEATPAFTQSGDYQVVMTDFYGCTSLSGVLSLELLTGYGTLTGQVYFDNNNNGILDAGDSPASGIDMTLSTAGSTVETATSNPIGNFAFANILSTDYTLDLDLQDVPPGWTPVLATQNVSLVGCDDEEPTVWLLQQAGCTTTTSAQSLSACAGESADYNGTPIPAGTTQVFTIPNWQGCDSIVTVTVAELATSMGTESFTACPGSFITYQNTQVAAGSSQDFTFPNWQGCDSVVTVTVTELATSVGAENFSACFGTSITYNGTDVPAGSSQDFTFPNWQGCDSVVTVTVTALPAPTGAETLSACTGSFATYNGQQLAAGSVTPFLFPSSQNCDSVVLVTVMELPASVGTENFSACPGESITYNGTQVLAGTSQAFTLLNWLNCDSTVTVTVTELPTSTGTANFSACTGGFITYNGTQVLAGTSQAFTLDSWLNCDSIVTVTVAELPISTNSVTLVACPGTMVSYNGLTLGIGDQATWIGNNWLNCDSVVQVNVVATVPPDTTFIALTLCPYQTDTVYNGTTLAPGDVEWFVFTSQSNCDSVVQVSVGQSPDVGFSLASDLICNGTSNGQINIMANMGSTAPYQYSIDGGQSFEPDTTFEGLLAGQYAVWLRDAVGCVFEEEIEIEAYAPLEIGAQDQLLSCGDSAKVTFNLSGPPLPYTYEWLTPEGSIISGDSVIWATSPGVYLLSVQNECETTERVIHVMPDADTAAARIYMPNSFSPNDDGINDCYRGYADPRLKLLSFKLLIFDRWGSQVFESRDIEGCWDGNFRGKPMNPAVLAWYIEAKVEACDGTVQDLFLEGGVTVVR